jgi:ATP-binding protein involved in chromosome partitioning
MRERPTAVPRNVRILPEGISIQWEDGHLSFYPHRFLRLNCRCAGCVGEWPNPGQINADSIPQDVQAVDYIQVGQYALQFLWDDIHYTGIYPYQALRDLCPCPICKDQA